MTNSSEHIRATEERITAALEGIAGLELTRVAEICGRYAAVFEFAPSASYSKFFSTSSYDDLSDLLSTVLDTLEHLQIDKETDVNIFTAEMFEYLCAEMLPTDGRTVSLTIKHTAQDTVAGPRGEQTKVIIDFVERPKKLILNKTNARALAHALGNETDDWRGARVALGVEMVKVGRNTVPSIRVKSATARPRNGNGNAQPQPPAPTYADGSTVAPSAIDSYRAYLAANDNRPPADVRELIAWQQGEPAQDDLFGNDAPTARAAALATAQGQLD
jgi:hypothetical protein